MSQPREPGSSLCHSAGTAQALGHGSGPSPALRLCLLQCQQSQPLSGRQLPAAPGWVCIPSRAGRSPRGAAGEAGAADGLEALVIFQNLFWDAIHCSSLGKDDLQAELLWPNELGGINWSFSFSSELCPTPCSYTWVQGLECALHWEQEQPWPHSRKEHSWRDREQGPPCPCSCHQGWSSHTSPHAPFDLALARRGTQLSGIHLLADYFLQIILPTSCARTSRQSTENPQ